MAGICDCGHHRFDHDDQAYPEIGFCHLCLCRDYRESKIDVTSMASV